MQDKYVTILAEADRLSAGRSPLRPAALAAEPLIALEPGSSVRHVLDDALARAGVQPRIALEGNDLALVRGLVARGMGLAILPRSFAELPGPPISIRSLSPPPRLTVALWWRQDRRLSPAARAFVDFTRSHRPGIRA